MLRTVFEEAGGFDVDLPTLEDTDLCWRVQLGDHSLELVADAVVHIRYRSSLEGSFRQTLLYGQYNVLIYKRYRSRGMPRLPLLPGLAKWLLLALRSPQLLSSSKRHRWIWQAGWRLGRLKGCLRYRTLGLWVLARRSRRLNNCHVPLSAARDSSSTISKSIRNLQITAHVRVDSNTDSRSSPPSATNCRYRSTSPIGSRR